MLTKKLLDLFIINIVITSFFGLANNPNDQDLMHLKSTILDLKYKNSSHAKSKIQSLISKFDILILNLELTWALKYYPCRFTLRHRKGVDSHYSRSTIIQLSSFMVPSRS